MITHGLPWSRSETLGESSIDHHFSDLHGLAAWCVHRNAVLALVVFEADVGLSLALEVALLSGDAFLAAKQTVAPKVLVALLYETEPRFIPN